MNKIPVGTSETLQSNSRIPNAIFINIANEEQIEDKSSDLSSEETRSPPKPKTADRPVCNICMKTFSQPGSRNRHIRDVHKIGVQLKSKIKTLDGKKRPFACKECGETFTQSGSRNRHIRTIHLVQPINSRKFINKPFKCNHCPRRFTQSGSLNRHCRKKHNL